MYSFRHKCSLFRHRYGFKTDEPSGASAKSRACSAHCLEGCREFRRFRPCRSPIRVYFVTSTTFPIPAWHQLTWSSSTVRHAPTMDGNTPLPTGSSRWRSRTLSTGWTTRPGRWCRCCWPSSGQCLILLGAFLTPATWQTPLGPFSTLWFCRRFWGSKARPTRRMRQHPSSAAETCPHTTLISCLVLELLQTSNRYHTAHNELFNKILEIFKDFSCVFSALTCPTTTR